MPNRKSFDPKSMSQRRIHIPRPAPVNEAAVKRVISGQEPRDLARYLMQARTNVAYIRGTGVVDLTQFGLGFGRHLVDEPQLPDHNTYITLDEYLVEANRRQLGF